MYESPTIARSGVSVLMLIILIVYPAGVVDPPAIDHVEIPGAGEGHVAFRGEVKDRIFRIYRHGAQP